LVERALTRERLAGQLAAAGVDQLGMGGEVGAVQAEGAGAAVGADG
jgi:hypothetical protein